MADTRATSDIPTAIKELAQTARTALLEAVGTADMGIFQTAIEHYVDAVTTLIITSYNVEIQQQAREHTRKCVLEVFDKFIAGA